MPELQQVMRDLTRVQLLVWRSASEMNWPYLWSTGSTKKLVWRHHQIQFLAYLTKSYSWSSKELEIMSALTKQSRISWDLAGRANESMSWQKTNACGSHFLPEVSLKSIRRSRKLKDKSGLAAGSFFMFDFLVPIASHVINGPSFSLRGFGSYWVLNIVIRIEYNWVSGQTWDELVTGGKCTKRFFCEAIPSMNGWPTLKLGHLIFRLGHISGHHHVQVWSLRIFNVTLTYPNESGKIIHPSMSSAPK